MVGTHGRSVATGIDNGQKVALGRPVHLNPLPKQIKRFVNIPSNRELYDRSIRIMLQRSKRIWHIVVGVQIMHIEAGVYTNK